MKTELEPISEKDAKRFAALEAVIQSGEGALLATAHALRDIKISRLYRENYATFEDYCQQRWGFTRQRGYQLVVFSEEVEMSTTVDTQPKNEREARAVRSQRKAISDRKPITDKVISPAPVVDVEPEPPKVRTLDQELIDATGGMTAPPKAEPALPAHQRALIDALKLNRDQCEAFIECVGKCDCDPADIKDAAKKMRECATLLTAYAMEISQ